MAAQALLVPCLAASLPCSVNALTAEVDHSASQRRLEGCTVGRADWPHTLNPC